eukprot:CAMPEP_0194276860 /NCGR_PEP_ID=MMETSP0169-20130528/9335_1 /TAXON_ID=218684 /ORGANISM="Corethron pennatum, Strain L29A3" /LENGTH=206 /DNA_ID=CAMNT_0039020673 /DNA_START=114 /DNA_END=734 /DNA_ORIENTATION=-
MPHLVYFPIAGRGGLIRLIAEYGGVKLTESTEMPDGVSKSECGSAGSIPILIDGDLKMNESTAIEFYVASIAPKLAYLTPQQRGKDAQFCCIKETVLGGLGKVLFGDKSKDDFHAVTDKFFPLIEGLLPAEGFVNGLDYPTVADLAVVIICDSYMPFGAAYKHGEIDLATKFPKLKAHSDRTKENDSVAAAVSKLSASLEGTVHGF